MRKPGSRRERRMFAVAAMHCRSSDVCTALRSFAGSREIKSDSECVSEAEKADGDKNGRRFLRVFRASHVRRFSYLFVCLAASIIIALRRTSGYISMRDASACCVKFTTEFMASTRDRIEHALLTSARGSRKRPTKCFTASEAPDAELSSPSSGGTRPH